MQISASFSSIGYDELQLIDGGKISDIFYTVSSALVIVTTTAVSVAVAFPPAIPVAAGVAAFSGSAAIYTAAIGAALDITGK